MWEPLLIGFKHVIENGLYFVCGWSQRVREQGLIGSVPVSMHGCPGCEHFIHLDLGNEPKACRRQRVCGKRMDALRTELREYFWDGEFRDKVGATVTADGKPHHPYSVFINPSNGKATDQPKVRVLRGRLLVRRSTAAAPRRPSPAVPAI